MPDSNKPPQDLSPDLKQIYDRVMNTPAKGGTPTPTPPPPPPATPAAPSTPPVAPESTKPAGGGINPAVSSQPPMQSLENEPFLTSAPPRPLQTSVGVKSFALGKEKKGEAKTSAVNVNGEKKGISKTLIIILIAIFFAAWTFFWVVFFFNPFA